MTSAPPSTTMPIHAGAAARSTKSRSGSQRSELGLDRLERGLRLGSVRRAGLGEGRLTAGALGAERLGPGLDQVERADAPAQVVSDADRQVGFALLGHSDDCHHAGPDLRLAVVDQTAQVLGL